MSMIACICPSELVEVAEAAAKDFSEPVTVRAGSMSQGVTVARKLMAQGADAIICRGGTAMALADEGFPIPIVELRVSAYDIARTLHKARQHGQRIGVIAFANMVYGIECLEEIMGIKLSTYLVHSETEVESRVKQAKQDGLEVVVGGGVLAQYAKIHGLKFQVIESGKEVFWQAFREAKLIAQARRELKERAEQLKTVIDYAYDGVVAVDQSSRITACNPVAQRLLGVSSEHVVGMPISDILPGAGLLDTLREGKEELGVIVELGQVKIIANRVPIIIDGRKVGAVATFQEITKIQQMEEKIRRAIYDTGHVARLMFHDIIGNSPEVLEAKRKAIQFAHVDSTVLIMGETGCGKEIFAQSIHNASHRAQGPFVAVNCAALPENLLESELFGYVEGAFTGANKKGKPGLFELAHGGTIFLDEISEIRGPLQGRLLRVLQEKQVMRIGHDRVIHVDLRVIAATNRRLEEQVAKGDFREDLYYRLNVLRLELPPLRKRSQDIPMFIHEFVRELCIKLDRPRLVITPRGMDLLIRYPWPGNIRELRNFVERMVVLARGGVVDEEEMLSLLPSHAPTMQEPTIEAPRLGDWEDAAIEDALRRAGGNQTRAAEILGISRTTLWRKRRSRGENMQ
ncbi:MAG: sigma 54-interacting transcriptional regulator [Bacillota bacterium]